MQVSFLLQKYQRTTGDKMEKLIEMLEIAYVAMCKVPDDIAEDLDISCAYGDELRDWLNACLEGDGTALSDFVNKIIEDVNNAN
jgi:hypothetical protein